MDGARERWHERELRARDLLLSEAHGDWLASDPHRLAALAIDADRLDREQRRRAVGQGGFDLGHDSDRAVAEVGVLRDLQEVRIRVRVRVRVMVRVRVKARVRVRVRVRVRG